MNERPSAGYEPPEKKSIPIDVKLFLVTMPGTAAIMGVTSGQPGAECCFPLGIIGSMVVFSLFVVGTPTKESIIASSIRKLKHQWQSRRRP